MMRPVVPRAAALALMTTALAFAGCGDRDDFESRNPDTSDDATERIFVEGCVAEGGTESECGCVWATLRARLSVEEINLLGTVAAEEIGRRAARQCVGQ
jgi:hypothetical protein